MVPGPLRPLRRALPAFVALIATASPTHAQSINLSWDDCGAAGTEIKSFACDVNTGVSFDLVGSFVAPPGINEFLGISADLRVAATTLPDWWKIGAGQCRTAATIAANFDPSPSCADLFNGNGVGAALYEVGGYGSNTARIVLQVALPLGYEQPLQSGLEYSAFHLVVLPARTTGASSCGGCLEPVRLTLNSIQVFQPDQANNNPILTSAGVRRIAYWQGATGSLPVIASFAPAGAAEGASVTVSGTGLTSASLVRFGGVASVPTTTSESEVGAMVPAGARTGALEVDTPFGTAASGGTFVVAPTIFQFIPAQAPVGASVRIYGRNFTGVTSVLFGAQPATFSVSSDSEIQATVPAGASSGSITVINLGGSGSRDGFALGPAVGGFNLSWNDCGIAGQSLQTFACNSNVGPGFLLVGSFVPPSGISELRGVSADLQIASTVLPDWWKFGPGQCRLSTPLTPSFDFAGMSACADPWGAAYGMAWFYNLGFYGPETARLRVYGDPLSTGVPVQPDREYYAFKIRIAQNKTAGTGICTGCSVPTSISLQSLNLNQFGTSTTLSLPLNGASVLWQGVPGPLPVIAGFTPPGGPVGTPVMVTGSNFLAANAVRFGAVSAAFSVVNDGEISTAVPAGAQSSRIEVRSPSGSGLSSAVFHLPPVLTDVIPPIAPIGSSVVLRGINLGGVSGVTFGGQSATFVVDSEQQLTATVPAGAVSGPIVVQNPGGSGQLEFTVGPTPTGTIDLSWDDCGAYGIETKTFACDANSGAPFPLVVSFRPPPGVVAAILVTSRIRLDATTLPDWWKHGTLQCRGDGGIAASLSSAPSCESPWPNLSGTTVQHTVDHYGPNTARLSVSTYVAPGSIDLSPEADHLAAQVLIRRSMSTGTGSCAGCLNHVRLTLEQVEITQTSDVPYNPVIVSPGTRSSVVWQGQPGPLPVITGVVPPAGAIGAPVTIQGSGLASTVGVAFNGTAASVGAASETSVGTAVPAGAVAGPVTVATRNGSASSGGTFIIGPHLINLRPGQAPVGTTITLEGTNFTGTTAVSFNGAAATFVVVDDTRVRAVVPAGASSGPVMITNAGGSDASDAPFVVGPVIESINLSWNDCGVAGDEFQTFACNSNSGAPFTLIGSFEPPAGIENLQSIAAELRFTTGGASFPDWWRFGPGFCRTTGDLTTSFAFASTACELPWSGSPAVTHQLEVGYGGPASARLRILATAPPGGAGPVDAGIEHYAFRLDVKRSMTQSGGCSGCGVPLRIELASIQLVQPASEGFDPVIITPADRTVAYWQRVPAPIPAVVSFEPVGGGPGTPVTVRGSSFTHATEVRFQSTSATFLVASDSAIVTIVPSGARAGPVRVSSADGTGSSSMPFQMAPQLLGFFPGQAPEGAIVTLNGLNFTGTTEVRFNGQTTSFDAVSDSMVNAVVPVGASSGPISISNLVGTSVSLVHFNVGPIIEGLWTVFDPPGGPSFMIETMVHDPIGKRMIVIAAVQTWSLPLVGPLQWNFVAAQSFPVPSAVFDAELNRVVAFGGDPSLVLTDPQILDLTVTPASWVPRATPSPKPSGRLLPATIYDPVRRRMIIHGGYVGSGTILNETWALSLDSFTWTQITPPGPRPANRWAHAAVYDPVHDRMVIHGGRTDAYSAVISDTWALSLSGTISWTQLLPTGTLPSLRAHATCTYDPYRGAMVLHGGWRPSSPDRLNETWLLNLNESPESWQKITTFGSVPPPLSHQAGAFDPDQARLVAIGGFPPITNNDKIWQLAMGSPQPPPVINAFAPPGGPIGSPVTLTGSGFSNVITVRFGSVAAPFTIVSDSEIQTTVPAGARSGPILAVTATRSAKSATSFFLSPQITHLSPPIAPAGTVIAVRGTGLSGATSVTINGLPTSHSTVSDDLLIVAITAATLSGPVQVTNPGGTHVGPVFTVGPTPEGTLDLAWDDCGTHGAELKTFSCAIDPGPPFPLVVSLRPPPGIRDLVSLIGDIRVSAATLPDWWKHGPGQCRGTNGLEMSLMGSSSCPTPWATGSNASWTYTIGYDGPGTAKLSVTATVPAGGAIALDPDLDQIAFRVMVGRGMAAGSPSCLGCSQRVRLELERIRLVQSGGIPFNPILVTPASRATAYWQGIPGPPPGITAVEPAGGPPGTLVTIRGRSLTAVSAVFFHGMPATFSVVDDTTLTAVVPPGARTGYIAIATADGSAQSPEVFHVAPRIISFAPTQAPIGSTVRVVGQNFGTTTDVHFGSVPTTYESVLDTLLLAVVPEGITQERLIVTNPGGADTSAAEFTVGSVPVSEGINLSWDDCGEHGVTGKTFACDANTGAPFTLVASFVPPSGIGAYLGLSAQIAIGNPGGDLPEWWKHGITYCRSSTALSSSFDFTGGPNSCQDVFAGRAVGGFLLEVGYPSPSRARLLVQAAMPLGVESPLDPATEYYGFKINISRSRTTGEGSCFGCSTPMCIQLNEIQLFQPLGNNNNPRISVPMGNNVATWQGATSCFVATPVQVSLVTAEAIAGEVRLAWELPRGDGATLYRREGEGEWTRVTRLTPDGDRRLSYVDREVRGGMTYGYRLGIMIGDEEIFAGETSVTVPARVAKLALSQVFWSGRSLNATVALPAAAGARFEVFDLGGRRAFSSALDHLEAGEHHLEFSPALRPGVYFGRLSQGGTKASARFVVVQ